MKDTTVQNLHVFNVYKRKNTETSLESLILRDKTYVNVLKL